MSDLLPPNSTPAERALAEAVSRLGDVPVKIREVWDADSIPLPLLPWLAWAYSVDEWDSAWLETQARDTVKSALRIQRQKGTVGAVRRALGALGLPARVQEWFSQTPAGAPYTFRLLLDVDQTPLTQADLVKILEVVERTKNLRSHLEVALLTITSVAAPSVAVVAGLGLDLGVSYSAPAYADGTPALDLLTDAAEYGEASTVAALDALHTLLHSTLTPSYW